ncbi:MAG: hypothetical protein F4Y08_11020 [Caldilineaceae bacterium SB0662_bin_9]|uniref:non-specific serine/threonine protein kinase n=1 Tax=Caldilineaceae bacterium SB0662_bin_9 TaxID=2605258 RepID=A0A6B1DSV8_9CHLR|nr:hypothetical protein [Caldilineaceae bacterium SB0662_bin_9]
MTQIRETIDNMTTMWSDRYAWLLGIGLAACLTAAGCDAYLPESPPAIDPDTFVTVSAGIAHTCAVRADGSVICWGHDHFGQASPPAGTFKTVSSGAKHSCGVRTDRSISCWGANTFGQATPPKGMFVAVAAGTAHTCALETNGVIVCWGDNTYGQAPTVVLGDHTSVSASNRHTCAVTTDYTLTCWGMDSFGRAPAELENFTIVSAGWDQTCGIRTDGTLACSTDDWTGYASHPELRTGRLLPPDGTYISVSTHEAYACALGTNRLLSCWGIATCRDVQYRQRANSWM